MELSRAEAQRRKGLAPRAGTRKPAAALRATTKANWGGWPSLEMELARRGIPFEAKKELRIFYKGEPIEKTYIPDLFCFGRIIVEIKAVERLSKEHRAQLMNYLRLTHSRLGLLVNFAAYPKVEIEQWAN